MSSRTARRLARRYRRRACVGRSCAARRPSPTAGARRRPRARRRGVARAARAARRARSSAAAARRRRHRRGPRADPRRRHDRARAIAESLREHPETRALGHLAAGIVAYRRGYLALAARPVPRRAAGDLWSRSRRPSTSASGLARRAGGDAGRQCARSRTTTRRTSRAKAGSTLLAAVFGLRRPGASPHAVFARLRPARRARTRRPGATAARTATGCGRGSPPTPDSPTAPRRRAGAATFAIIDYGHPGANRGSANIGDHVQSIAALGHLVRHRGVRLHGERGARRPARRRSRDRERPELRARRPRRRPRGDDGPPRRVDVPGDPRGHVGPLLRLVHARALHACATASRCTATCGRSSSRSTATSATCSRPEAIEYLRRYGPVGCRDWTTIYLLLSIGVPGLLLRLPDDDDRHRVPRCSPRRRGRRAGRLRRRAGGGGPAAP